MIKTNDYIWTTAVGAWGDTICAYGNICKLLKERNEEKANIVFFGLDQNVCELLKAQDKIAKVEWLKCDPPFAIGKYLQMAHTDPEGWHTFTGVKDVIPEIHFTHLHNQEPYRDFECKLPPCAGDWKEFLESRKPYTLFQPYSTQSCDYAGHWPHWKQALKFIVSSTNDNVVVVGELPDEDIDSLYDDDIVDHQQVTCLLGQTKTMIDVLHIASWAESIVTTCNALAYWAILNRIPSIVACNNVIKAATPYYHKWLNYKTLFLDHDASFDEFESKYYIMSEGNERRRSDLSSVN